MYYKNPLGIAPVIQVHPLRRCNIACSHCYTSSSPYQSQELELDLLKNCLDDAFSLGYRQIAVSGGEPLLYKPLRELLRHAKSLGMITTVTTNGMLITPLRWEGLSELIDVTAISIDGTPEEHDFLRRHNGAFNRTLANLKVLRDSGSRFGFIFTLTQHNVSSLEFIVRLAAEQGARSVQVHPLTLVGRAADKLTDACPDHIELTAAIIEASRLAEKLGVVVQVDALEVDQLKLFRNCFVPDSTMDNLSDIVPTLIVQADALIVPLSHEINPSLYLGSLLNEKLSALADNWMNRGLGKRLTEVSEITWNELVNLATGSAMTWFDEVSLRSHHIN